MRSMPPQWRVIVPVVGCPEPTARISRPRTAGDRTYLEARHPSSKLRREHFTHQIFLEIFERMP